MTQLRIGSARVNAERHEHGQQLGVKGILPAGAEHVVVPVRQSGGLAAAVLESQRIGLEPDPDVEADAVPIPSGIGGKRQVGPGAGQPCGRRCRR